MKEYKVRAPFTALLIALYIIQVAVIINNVIHLIGA